MGYPPFLKDLAMSSSLKPPKPNDLATSLYCCATGFRGVKSVPKASKQMKRFFLDIIRFVFGGEKIPKSWRLGGVKVIHDTGCLFVLFEQPGNHGIDIHCIKHAS